MKKLFHAILALLLILMLTGCSKHMAPEDVVAQYPWLVGNWGEIGDFEDNVSVVMNSDGTCSVEGTPGVWNVPKDWEIDYKVAVEIQLENDISYSGEFINDKDMLEFIIWNDKTGQAVSGKYIPDGNKNISLEEYKSIIGAWADLPNVFTDISGWTQVLELREDGSCSILGEDGLWVPKNHYASMEDSGKAEHYELLAKVNDSIYTISIYDPAHTNFHLLTVWDENFNQVAEASVNLSLTEVIDITTENLLDYFELKEYSVWEKDAFGDFTRLVVAQYLEIKPQYAEAVYLMNEQITAEVECDAENCIISVEPALKEWTILSSEAVGKESVIVNFMEIHSAEAGDSFGALIDRFNHTYDEEECGGHGHTSSINIIRAVGKLYLDSTKIQQESVSN